MTDVRESAGAGAPLWIQCTLADSKTPIHVNMAYAATFVAHGGGSQIWIPDERRALDVVESPTAIVEAIRAAERKPPPRQAPEPRPFAFPLARPGSSRH